MSVAGGSPAEEESGSFTSIDGTELAFRVWRPALHRASMVLVHGLGEHSGRYPGLARAVAPLGVTVHAFDLRGHGRSPGQRGHARRLDNLVGDVLAFRERVVRHSAASPTFLFGHSLGGLIALRTVQLHADVHWSGLILSAPALGVRMHVPAWKKVFAAALARVLPRLSVDNGIDPADLSRDPAVVASYRTDPLVHRRISARLYSEMRTGAAEALEAMDGASLPPSLWLVPTGDRICDADAVLSAAEGLPPGSSARVRRFEGAFHEALNDIVRDEVKRDITGWLEEQLPA